MTNLDLNPDTMCRISALEVGNGGLPPDALGRQPAAQHAVGPREIPRSVTARTGSAMLTNPTYQVGAGQPRAARSRRKPPSAAPEETPIESS